MPWMRRLFARRYPNNFDAAGTEQWMAEVVLKAPLRFNAIRTDDALCISLVTEVPWLPTEREVSVVVILADHGAVWQTIPLLRASIEWARYRQASAWRFHSNMPAHCTALARRVGVPLDVPHFKLHFGAS